MTVHTNKFFRIKSHYLQEYVLISSIENSIVRFIILSRNIESSYDIRYFNQISSELSRVEILLFTDLK